VRQCVSLEETRFYLDGVRIEPREAGGVWMVATDGQLLAVAKDEQGRAPFPCTIQLDKTLADFIGPTIDHDDYNGEPYRVWNITDAHRLHFDGLKALGECAVARTSCGTATAGGVTGLVWRGHEAPKTGWVDWRRVLRAHDCTLPPKPGDVGTFAPALIEKLSYQGRGVAIMPRSGVATDSNGKTTPSALVLAEGAPWGFGVLMPRKIEAMRDLSETLRELVAPQDMAPHGNAITQDDLDRLAAEAAP
jgi:hypothetical protein